jgi:hypothetical protein
VKPVIVSVDKVLVKPLTKNETSTFEEMSDEIEFVIARI